MKCIGFGSVIFLTQVRFDDIMIDIHCCVLK